MLPYTCWRSLCVQPDPWRHALHFSLHPPAVRISNCRHPSQTPRPGARGPVKRRPVEARPRLWAFRPVICLPSVSAGCGFRGRRPAARRGRNPAGASSIRRRPAVGFSIVRQPIERWSTSGRSARSGQAGLSGSGCMMRSGERFCGTGKSGEDPATLRHGCWILPPGSPGIARPAVANS